MEAVIINPAIRADDFNSLKEGDRVPFDIQQGQKGPAAANVAGFCVNNAFIYRIGGTPFPLVHGQNNRQGGDKLARSNYQFNKRQKELARKKKKAEKRASRLAKKTVEPDETPIDSQNDEADSSV